MNAWQRVMVSVMGVFLCGPSLATGRGDGQRELLDRGTDRAEEVSGSPLHPWTPRDSVGIRYFGPEGVVPSPDGSHFFFTTARGDLSCDCNVYEFKVYSTDDVRQAIRRLSESGARADPVTPEPVLCVTRRSSMRFGKRFFAPNWEPDGQSINFQGASDDGTWQLFTLDIRTRQIRALTHWPRRSALWPGGVDVLEVTRVGETVVAGVYVPLPTPWEQYPAHVITPTEFRSLLVPEHEIVRAAEYVSYRDGAPWEIQSLDQVSRSSLFFSKGGKLLVAVGVATDVPKVWAAYDGVSIGPETGHIQNTDLERLVLIDAEHGRELRSFDVPAGTVTRVGREHAASVPVQALWAKDGSHVVLVNAALPLTASSGSQEHARMAYVVSYDVPSRKWQVLEPLQAIDSKSRALRTVSGAGWLEEGTRLLISHEASGKSVAGTVYSLQGGRWNGEAVDASLKLPATAPPKPPVLSGGVTVTLRQSSNDPPTIVASYEGQDLALTAPDPALQEARLTRQEPFTWHTPEGRELTGGLLTPPEASRGPVPLVIQAYQYSPDKFTPDGPDSQAYAAQTLATRGIAVLNVTIPALYEHARGIREFTDFVEEIDSAVDALKERALIDPTHVGVIGFSRAGTEVYYAITHPGRHPLAAATVHDEFVPSYTASLLLQALVAQNLNFVYGGDFWTHKDTWLKDEPTFNADRVVTPTLFTVRGESKVLEVFDTFGAFSMLHLPFEYLSFPRASHGLEMPRERLASQEATADWMAFWLKEYVDPDPQKVAQYMRWKILREQANERRPSHS